MVLQCCSGCDLSQPGSVLQRGERVAVVLDPAMTQAWCDAGESWLAVNPVCLCTI